MSGSGEGDWRGGRQEGYGEGADCPGARVERD